MVLVDLGAAKDTVRILAALQAAYPHPSSPADEALHDLLGPVSLETTGRALEALRAGDAPGLGRILTQAQADFDQRAGPVCPDQLGAPALHRLLDRVLRIEGVLGAKGVGSQGDGTAQVLCSGPRVQQEVCRVVSGELGMVPLTTVIRGV